LSHGCGFDSHIWHESSNPGSKVFQFITPFKIKITSSKIQRKCGKMLQSKSKEKNQNVPGSGENNIYKI
jgi:hypothetical protein